MSQQVLNIRNELRHGQSPSLNRRRKIGLLSAIGLIDFAIISLYQIGVIRHLPDLPARIFDSDTVNASEKAYKMHLPDGTTGTALYATNLMLCSFGGSNKTGRSPWLSAALGLTVAGGALGALDYLFDMTFKQKKVCLYCVTGAAVNFLMVPLAWKEIKENLLPLS